MVGFKKKTVTYDKISPKVVNPGDTAGDTKSNPGLPLSGEMPFH